MHPLEQSPEISVYKSSGIYEEPMWRMAITVLALAGLPAPAQDEITEEKVKELVEKLGSDYLDDRNQARDELIKASENERNRGLIEKHLVQQIGGDDPRIKLLSIEILTKIGNRDEKVIRAVGRMFETEQDDETVLVCFEYLRSAGEPAEEYLIKALDRKGPIYKKGALEKLREFKSVRAMDRAYEIYATDEDQKVKEAAFQLLKALGLNAKKYLIKLISDPNNAQIRKESIQGLMEVRDDEVIRAVGTQLKAEVDDQAMMEAFKYLRACPADKVEGYLIDSLESQNPKVQTEALTALAEVKSTRALDKVSEVAKKTPNLEVKKACIRYYAAFPEKTEAFLIEMLGDANAAIRMQVIEDLSLKRSKVGFDKIREVFKGDKDEEVRKRAFNYFVRIGADAADVLIEGLKDKNRDIRRDAIETAGELRLERAVEALLDVLRREDQEQDSLAINALAKIGKPAILLLEEKVKSAPGLKEVLTQVTDIYEQVQVELALSDLITERGTTGAFDGMFRKLGALDLPRDRVSRALIVMQSEEYRPRTKKFMGVDIRRLNKLAVLALGEVGDAGAKNHLKSRFEKLLAAPDYDDVVEDLAVALAKLGDKKAVEDLIARLSKEAEAKQREDRPLGLERLFSLAIVQNRAGDRERALETYKRLEKLISEDKDKDPELLGKVLYNMACLLSLKGDKAAAVEYLRKAVETGFKDRDWIQLDGDLDAIRGEEGYRKLIADDRLFRED